MVLRDHSHDVEDIVAWQGFHAQWPAMMVLDLSRKLPPCFASPRVQLRSSYEIDVSTLDEQEGTPGHPPRGSPDGHTIPA